MKIAVIGAGPAGSQAAYCLASCGYKVDVFEEHPVIGKPVQCTGIISKNLKNIIPVSKEFVVNEVKGAVIYSKHQKLEIKTGKTQAFIIDRTRLDKFLAERARKQGANFYLNHKFLGYEKVNNRFILKFYYRTKIITKEADILIGADGPLSKVGKQAGLLDTRQYLYGIQARVKGEFDKEHVQLYLGSVCPFFFAWLVPESDKYARIGLAAEKNSRALFNNFISRFDCKIINKQAGLIPVYKKSKVNKAGLYLVGDAAAHVKATTGGGVVMSLLAAKALAKSIHTKIPYKYLLRKLNSNLWLTGKIRNRMNRLSDNDYDCILRLLKQPRLLGYLKSKGDMDFQKPGFWLRFLAKEPRLLKYLFQPCKKHHKLVSGSNQLL
jgi:geranylgeranyl reductase family protein